MPRFWIIIFCSLLGLWGCSQGPASVKLYQSDVSRSPLALPELAGQVESTAQGDRLSFRVQLPPRAGEGFRAAGLDLGQIKYLRCWVRGRGISDRMWNKEGFVDVAGNPNATLGVPGIPKGPNRIVSAQGYDLNQQPIPGALLKAVYSSPPQDGTVTVLLKWRFVPAGEVLEYLLEQAPELVGRMDAAALQQKLEAVMQPAGNGFAVHPTRLDTAAIAQELRANPSLPALVPKLRPLANAPLVVRNPANLPFAGPVQVAVSDPNSAPFQIPGGSDSINLAGIVPGSWEVVARLNGLNGGVAGRTTLTVAADGQATLGQGTAGNPLILPPVITAIEPAPVPADLIAWWKGDGNADDLTGAHPGTLQGGTLFAPGREGQGFSFDGRDDYVSIPDHADFDLTGDFTISSWVRKLGPWLQTHPMLVVKNPINDAYLLWVDTDSVPLENSDFAIRVNLGALFTCRSGVIPVTGPWYHVVGQRDGSNLRIYVNGVLQNTCAVGAAPMATSNGPLTISDDAASTDALNAVVDDVSMYRRALSAQEIQSLYTRHFRLNGDGFAALPGNNTLLLGGAAVPVLSATPASLLVALPAAATGNPAVTVTTGGKTSNQASFAIAPALTDTSALAAAPGTPVVLTGSGFAPLAGNNTVLFNGIPANITAASTTSLTVQVPAGAAPGPITIATAGGTVTGPVFNPVPASLVSWWQADNHPRDTVSANHGTLQSGTAFAPGKAGNAFSFDGVDDFVQIPDAANLDLTQLTVTAWVRFNNIASDIFVSKGLFPNYNFKLDTSGGVIDFVVGIDGAQRIAADTTAYTTGTWYHVAGTYDGANVRLYVNGALKATTPYAGVPAQNNDPVVLGKYFGGVSYELNGLLDEVRLYNVALSAAEIQALYNASL